MFCKQKIVVACEHNIFKYIIFIFGQYTHAFKIENSTADKTDKANNTAEN